MHRLHAKCPRNIGAVNDHSASLAIFWTCRDRRSARWVARSSVGSRVARRLPGRHSLVTASRCAAGLDFLLGAVPREGRHLGALKVVFCPQAHAGHVS